MHSTARTHLRRSRDPLSSTPLIETNSQPEAHFLIALRARADSLLPPFHSRRAVGKGIDRPSGGRCSLADPSESPYGWVSNGELTRWGRCGVARVPANSGLTAGSLPPETKSEVASCFAMLTRCLSLLGSSSSPIRVRLVEAPELLQVMERKLCRSQYVFRKQTGSHAQCCRLRPRQVCFVVNRPATVHTCLHFSCSGDSAAAWTAKAKCLINEPHRSIICCERTRSFPASRHQQPTAADRSQERE